MDLLCLLIRCTITVCETLQDKHTATHHSLSSHTKTPTGYILHCKLERYERNDSSSQQPGVEADCPCFAAFQSLAPRRRDPTGCEASKPDPPRLLLEALPSGQGWERERILWHSAFMSSSPGLAGCSSNEDRKACRAPLPESAGPPQSRAHPPGSPTASPARHCPALPRPTPASRLLCASMVTAAPPGQAAGMRRNLSG